MAKKLKPLRKRQKQLARNIRKGMTIKDAGLAAGFATKQSAHNAYKRIKLRFHPALEAAGYNVDQEVTEIYAKIKEKMECREVIWGQSNGIFMDSKTVIPHDIQLRAANDAGRFIGAIGNGHDNGEPPPVGARPGHISLTLELPAGTDTKALVAISSGSPVRDEQPVLDVEQNQNPRRPGSDPSL